MANIITLTDIVLYIGVGVRPLIEGDQVLRAGHVIKCGKIVNETKIVALCLQTSGLTHKPHKIDIELNTDYREWLCVCTCKAGAGRKCKHIIAVLLHLHNLSADDLTPISCTELEQAWGKRKDNDKTLKIVPLDEFCHHTRDEASEDPAIPESFLDDFFMKCLEAVPNSEAALHFNGQDVEMEEEVEMQVPHLNDKSLLGNALRCHLARKWSISFPPIQLSAAHLQFYTEDVIVTLNTAVDLALNTVTQSASNLWHSQRKLRITASRCYELFTYTRNISPTWERKLDSIMNSKFTGNAATEYGTRQENNAIAAYENTEGCAVQKCGLVVHPVIPWLGFSPDGLILDGSEIKKMIEIKCPVKGSEMPIEPLMQSKNISFLCYLGGRLCLRKKHKYYGQVQLSMGLLQIAACDLIVYSSFNSSYICVPVEFDNEFFVELLNSLHYVYFTYYLPALQK